MPEAVQPSCHENQLSSTSPESKTEIVPTPPDPILAGYLNQLPELSLLTISLPPLLQELVKQKSEWTDNNLRP